MPTALVVRLYRTFQLLIHELAKFGVVGAAAYVVDVGIADFLHLGSPHLGPITSKAISTLVAATGSYFANRHWTWRHRARTGLLREYGVFFGLSLVGLAITEACVGFTYYVVDLRSALAYNLSANVVGVILGTVFRFWSFKRWVFLEPSAVAEKETAHAAVQ
ncbi:MAG: GtrA family protein [Mycobacteriales bacterium]